MKSLVNFVDVVVWTTATMLAILAFVLWMVRSDDQAIPLAVIPVAGAYALMRLLNAALVLTGARERLTHDG